MVDHLYEKETRGTNNNHWADWWSSDPFPKWTRGAAPSGYGLGSLQELVSLEMVVFREPRISRLLQGISKI